MNVIHPYKGVFIAGYVITGLLTLTFFIASIYCTLVKGKPKFIKYENNNGGNEEDEKLP
jgi:hypothetical protein